MLIRRKIAQLTVKRNNNCNKWALNGVNGYSLRTILSIEVTHKATAFSGHGELGGQGLPARG